MCILRVERKKNESIDSWTNELLNNMETTQLAPKVTILYR